MSNGTPFQGRLGFDANFNKVINVGSPSNPSDAVNLSHFDTYALKDVYTPTGSGTVSRTITGKVKENITLKDYGAVGDGVADDIPAITAMAADKGYVVYPAGTFRINATYTISVPQYFGDGASLTIDTGITLNITNRVHSPNQWIFKGDGVVLFRIVETGEDAQLIQAGWFGAFPSNSNNVDVTAKVQRALSSLSSQTREGILQFEMGSYHLSGTLYVPRGVHVAGRGMRRTVFDITGFDYTVFETAGNACKFTDFQFEYPSGSGGIRTAPYIHVKHNTCDIESLWLFPSTVGIIIDQPQCYVRNIRATYGLDPLSVGVPDTCLIWCRAGSFTIDNVIVMNTTFSPHHIIRVGYNVTVGAGIINNIQSSQSSNPVFLDGRACAITRVIISNIMGSPSAGSQFDALVKVVSAGAFIVNYITVQGLVGNSYANSLVHIEASGTSIVSNIAVGTSTLHGTSGYGVRLLNYGTGSIRNICISDDVDVSSRATRLEIVGITSALTIPATLKGSQFTDPDIQNFVLADDTAYILNTNRASVFAGTLIISSSNPAIYGIFSFRAATSSNHVTLITGHANMATATTPLAGTTGTDGKFTVGINASGQLVVENRIGSSAVINANILAGI